ncbi:MAG: hypothetical protein H2674_22000 [Limnospira indica BM01]|nr:MAG: hypothetical protein H2674_22000 [Limnospira indica BM01]
MGVLFLTRCAAMDEERSQAYLSLIQEPLIDQFSITRSWIMPKSDWLHVRRVAF